MSAVLVQDRLQPHEQRVVQELAELRDKIGKLSNFVGELRRGARSVSAAQDALLVAQLSTMEDYEAVLAARVRDFMSELAATMRAEEPTPLTFDMLRLANTMRLPVFRNSRGETAHSRPDGSDWTPAQWLQALFGELGEYATLRAKFEAGEITYDQYATEAAKELADVQCYLDILARRALDKTIDDPLTYSPAQELQFAISLLGEFANKRKKYERGDFSLPGMLGAAAAAAGPAALALRRLLRVDVTKSVHGVVEPHPTGVDLGAATAAKFNEVSRRVNADVWLPEAA